MPDSNPTRKPTAQPDMPATIRVCGSNYDVLRKISRGDGRRYQIRQRRPHGDIRQLLILPRDATTRQHLRVLRRLSQANPSFPTIIDTERQGGEIRVITTWVEGEDLQAHLRPIKRGESAWETPFRIIKLYRGLAHGLCQLHKHPGVFHGDISPKNLILTRGPERLVMVDFGSAWTVERTTSRDAGDGLTGPYAAPEQHRKEAAVNFQADQFSASVVAYEMLTGVCPYAEQGGLAGLPEKRARLERLYRSPSSECPACEELPRRIWRLVDEVVGRGLRLDADARYQRPADWLEALEDIHCEMRRKTQFGRLDMVVRNTIRRFANSWGGQKAD